MDYWTYVYTRATVRGVTLVERKEKCLEETGPVRPLV